MEVRLGAFSQHFVANQVGIPSGWVATPPHRSHLPLPIHITHFAARAFRLLGNQDSVQFHDMRGIYHVSAARRQYIQKPAKSW